MLDPATLEYKPAAKVSLPAVEQARNNDSLVGRLKALLAGDPAKDKAAKFYWRALPELWTYAANRIGEVSESPGRDRPGDGGGVQLGEGSICALGCGGCADGRGEDARCRDANTGVGGEAACKRGGELVQGRRQGVF